MSEFNSGPPEIDPDIAQIQARQRGAASAIENLPVPPTAFVASINNIGGDVTLQAGTSSPGVTVGITNGATSISIAVTGFGALATIKCNLTAVVAPVATDDSSLGYGVGSIWSSTAPETYICQDATVGAAVWRGPL